MILTSLLAAALMMVLILWAARRRLEQRTRLVAQILDLADATERSLRECRLRLNEIRSLIAATDGARELCAHTTRTAQPEVQAALRDLLAHRLWLKAHAGDANLAALRSARDALLQSRTALTNQLGQLAAARDELDRAHHHAVPAPHGHGIAARHS